MIDFTKLVNLDYLFETRPEVNSELIFLLSLIFALLILASGGLWLSLVRRERQRPYLKDVRRRFVTWAFTSGFVGLFLVFFRATGIPYFGMRALLLAWLVVSGLWLIVHLRYLLKRLPKERSLYEEQRLRERYLPKKRVAAR